MQVFQMGLASDLPLTPAHTQLDFPQAIVGVCVGSSISLFLGKMGEGWTCGTFYESTRMPRQIDNLPPIQAISCSSTRFRLETGFRCKWKRLEILFKRKIPARRTKKNWQASPNQIHLLRLEACGIPMIKK